MVFDIFTVVLQLHLLFIVVVVVVILASSQISMVVAKRDICNLFLNSCNSVFPVSGTRLFWIVLL